MKRIFSQINNATRIVMSCYACIVVLLASVCTVNFSTRQAPNSTIDSSQRLQIPQIAGSTSPILIDGHDPSQNWSKYIALGYVTGTGIPEDPYVIQDLIIDASGSGSCIFIANTNEDFRIENCTVTNSGTNELDAGIRLENSTYGVIRNNTCVSNYFGINLYQMNCSTIDGNTCAGNSIMGIIIESCFNSVFYGNNCSSNIIHGIFVTSTLDNNTLSGNICSGNEYGIYVLYSSNTTISKNNCTDNEMNGISIHSSTSIVANENFCTRNGEDGIFLHASYCTISGNNCTTNAVDGIHVRYTSYSTITENNITENSIGMYFEGNEETQVVLNTARDNSASPIMQSGSEDCDIIYNWFWYVPVAQFSTNTTDYWIERPIAFTDTTTGDGPLAYQWNFGDATGNFTANNPTHAFALPGNYTVVLTVTDFDGDIAVSKLNVTVGGDPAPVAFFAMQPATVTLGQWVAFTDGTTSGDAPLAYHWDFGDGTESSDRNPTHKYSAAGSFTVTLTVTDATGNVSVYQGVIVVQTVVPPGGQPDPTPIMIGITIAGAGATGFAIILRRRRHHTRVPT